MQNKAHLQKNAQGREPIQRQRNKHNLLRLQWQKPLHILHISAVASCRRGILKRSSCLACSLSGEQGGLRVCVQVDPYFGTQKQAIYSSIKRVWRYSRKECWIADNWVTVVSLVFWYKTRAFQRPGDVGCGLLGKGLSTSNQRRGEPPLSLPSGIKLPVIGTQVFKGIRKASQVTTTQIALKMAGKVTVQLCPKPSPFFHTVGAVTPMESRPLPASVMGVQTDNCSADQGWPEDKAVETVGPCE